MRVATYQRVSTIEQTTANQAAALKGWLTSRPDSVLVHAYKDTESGAKTSRPAFDRLLRHAKSGMFDVLVVWRLDRILGSSLRGMFSSAFTPARQARAVTT
jgi:site-specific DNA recombinase